MPFDHDDPYVTVECTIKGATAKAVRIEDAYSTVVWVPRSCIHGGDDIALKQMAAGDAMQLRVRQWFARKEGLV